MVRESVLYVKISTLIVYMFPWNLRLRFVDRIGNMNCHNYIEIKERTHSRHYKLDLNVIDV